MEKEVHYDSRNQCRDRGRSLGLGERGAFLPVRNRHAGDNDEGADYLEYPQLFL